MTWSRTLIVTAVLMLTFLVRLYADTTENTPLIKPLNSFPRQIGPWSGRESRFDQRVYDILGVDDSFLADYTNPQGRAINLYIGYYQSQREGDLIHSPKNCMPGAGWKIMQTTTEHVKLPDNGQSVEVIKMILQKGPHQQAVYYWFQSRGRIIASEYAQKVYLVIDSITRHRTDEAFVRLIAPISAGAEEQAFNDLRAFTQLLMPVLGQHLPA